MLEGIFNKYEYNFEVNCLLGIINFYKRCFLKAIRYFSYCLIINKNRSGEFQDIFKFILIRVSKIEKEKIINEVELFF